MEDLAIFGGLAGVAWAFAWMVAKLSEHWMMKKIADGPARPELISSLRRRAVESPARFTALKWGMVVVALGLGLLVEDLFPYDFEDPAAYGVLLVLGGGALILYYVYVETREGPPDARDGEPSPPPGP